MKKFFLILVFFISYSSAKASELELVCKSLHGSGDLTMISVIGSGTKSPKVNYKISGEAMRSAKILSADKYEIIWTDGWGPTYTNDGGLCEKSMHVPTEKRLNLRILESSEGHPMLQIFLHYATAGCREEDGKAIRFAKGDKRPTVWYSDSNTVGCLISEFAR